MKILSDLGHSRVAHNQELFDSNASAVWNGVGLYREPFGTNISPHSSIHMLAAVD